MAPIMRQQEIDIEHAGADSASEPLLPVAMGATPAPEVKTTNCCMIACCAPLAIKNGGGQEPDPEPSAASAPVHHHKAWANVFKANVVMTVVAAVWFGGMALEALANDSLTGEGRRRLMHENHGDHSHHSHHSHHHNESSKSGCFLRSLSGSPHFGFAVSPSLGFSTFLCVVLSLAAVKLKRPSACRK